MKVCLCILMNHPYPGNLPLLRRIYGGKFSSLLFLVPFERMADDDVVTVYRGSYNHATYLTDAYGVLSKIDCDHFLVVHDDVLLNPALTEESFDRFFGLGPDEGFIAKVGSTPDRMSTSVWSFGMVARTLYPKSLLFGSGIEPTTLQNYLPSPERLHQAFAANGVEAQDAIRFDVANIREEVMGHPLSRLLLKGLAGALPATEGQAQVEEASGEASRLVLTAMLRDQRGSGAGIGGDEDHVALPFPTVGSAYYTDLYVLPRSALADYCHYIGVAGAANLFVEIIAPTILHACCARVRTAADAELDTSGFQEAKDFQWLRDPRALAIHPVKFSLFGGAADGDAFVETLRCIAAGEPIPEDLSAAMNFGAPNVRAMPGWHDGEPWGVWSATPQATIPILAPGPVDITLTLRGPVGPQARTMTGRIRYGDEGEVPLSFAYPEAGEITLEIAGLAPDEDGIARIHLFSDGFVVPAELIGTGDHRRLHIGVSAVHRRPAAARAAAPA